MGEILKTPRIVIFNPIETKGDEFYWECLKCGAKIRATAQDESTGKQMTRETHEDLFGCRGPIVIWSRPQAPVKYSGDHIPLKVPSA